MRHKKGFTLIEVLTVIVIILILVAISIPVFFQVRARAKQTVCMSNLHQVYLAIQLYSNDFNELPHLAYHDPAWIPYMGGTLPRCPRTLGEKWPHDYFITAGPLLDVATNPASALWSSMLAECKEKRGSEFPYAYDFNHRKNVDGYQSNGQRMLIVRASGSVVNVPFKNDYGPWWPCDRRLGIAIQH